MTHLSSVACNAAIELDNIRLKRNYKTSSIEQLIKIFEAGIPPRECRDEPLNLLTELVVFMIPIMRNPKPDAMVIDVVADMEVFVTGLVAVVSRIDPDDGEIEQLQRKCLDISRLALSRRRRRLLSI